MHIIVNWPEGKPITLNSVIAKWLTAKQIDGFIHGWLPKVSDKLQTMHKKCMGYKIMSSLVSSLILFTDVTSLKTINLW